MKYIKSLKESLSFSGYTYEEILRKTVSGDLKLDLMGHCEHHLAADKPMNFTHPPINYFQRMLHNYEHSIKFRSSREGEMSDALKDYYKKMNEEKYMPGQPIYRTDLDSKTCPDCGKHLRPILKDEHTVTWMPYEFLDSILGNKKTLNDVIDVNKIPVCEGTKLGDKSVTEIHVNDTLVFSDNFRANKDLDGDGDLSSLLGTIKIQKNLAELNIGMGQMTNTSVSIWRNKQGTEIIITETEKRYNGYVKIGDVSCGVWRWMCADKTTLENLGVSIPETTKEGEIEDDLGIDTGFVFVNVQHGTWVIEHYFDIVGLRKDGLYSKLYLK